MAFTNILITGLVLQMELRGEDGSIYKGLWSMHGGIVEPSRKLHGMQTIIVHEVAAGPGVCWGFVAHG